ncbi:hypothetical protein PFFVO_06208, partial [Plasmodium falciparum Vietnam Oak-Knoll (FVO)]
NNNNNHNSNNNNNHNSNNNNNHINRDRYINHHNIISNEYIRQQIKYTNINFNNHKNDSINENVRNKSTITQVNGLNYNTNEKDKEKINHNDNHIHTKRIIRNYSNNLDMHFMNNNIHLDNNNNNNNNNCNYIRWENIFPYCNSCKNKYANKFEINNFDNNIMNKYEKYECTCCGNKIRNEEIYNILGKVTSENLRNIYKSNRINNTDNILRYNRENEWMSSFFFKENNNREIYKEEYDEYKNDFFLNIKEGEKSMLNNIFRNNSLKEKLINEENITKTNNNVYVNILQNNDIEKVGKQQDCNNSLLQLSLYRINKTNNNNDIIIHNNCNINNINNLNSGNNTHSSNNVVSTNNIESRNYRNDLYLNTNDRIIFHQYKNSCMINHNNHYEINKDYNKKCINECEAEDIKDTNEVKEISNDVLYNYLNDMNDRFFYNYLDDNEYHSDVRSNHISSNKDYDKKYYSNNNYHNNHNCSNHVYYNYDSIISSPNQMYKNIQECKDINLVNDMKLYKLGTIKNKYDNIINEDIMQSYKNKYNNNNNYYKGNVENYYDINSEYYNNDIKIGSNILYDFFKNRNSTESTLLINHYNYKMGSINNNNDDNKNNNNNNDSSDNNNNNNNDDDNNNYYYYYNINSDLLLHQLNNICNNRNNNISLERRLNYLKDELINKKKTNETGKKEVDDLRNLKSKRDVFSYIENCLLNNNIEKNKNYIKLKINEIEDTKRNNQHYKNYDKYKNNYDCNNNNNNNVIFNIDENACKTSDNRSRTQPLQNKNINKNEYFNSIKIYENINENYNVLVQNINNIRIKNEKKYPEQNSHRENNNDVINDNNSDDNRCNDNTHLMNQINNTNEEDSNVKIINDNVCSFSNNNIKETFKDKKKVQDILHINGQCKPCAFFYNKNKGCRNGDSCEFCHHIDHSNLSLKQWKKQQKKMMKLGLLHTEKQNKMGKIDIANKEKQKNSINMENLNNTNNNIINNENYIRKDKGKLNEANNIADYTSESNDNSINKSLNNYDIFISQHKLYNDVTSMDKKEFNKQSDHIFNNYHIDGYNVDNVRSSNHISNNSIIINKRQMMSNNKIVINNHHISNKNMIFNNNIINNNIIMYNKKKSNNSSSSCCINTMHGNNNNNNFQCSNILRNMTNQKIDIKDNMILKKISTNNCEMNNLNSCSFLSNSSENGSYKTDEFLNVNEKYRINDLNILHSNNKE